MPLRTWRWSRQRPPRLGVMAGSRGASRSHSSSVISNRRFTTGFYRITSTRHKPIYRSEKHALVLQSQFSALLLVVGATSGGLMASSPDRPGKGERRVDRWAPDQAGQQPAQLGDGERDQHAQGGHHDRPPS